MSGQERRLDGARSPVRSCLISLLETRAPRRRRVWGDEGHPPPGRCTGCASVARVGASYSARARMVRYSRRAARACIRRVFFQKRAGKPD